MTDTIVYTHASLASEIVKLKQEMAELRAAIERIDECLGDLLRDHDGNYSPTLKPLDDGWGHAEDGWPWVPGKPGCVCDKEHTRLRDSTAARWHCPVHGNCAERVSR